MHTIFISC